jgi:Zn-dependent alcohol dehydrogenase
MNYGTIQAYLAMLNLGPNAATPLSAERDFTVFIRGYREGKLRLNDLVTHRYSLEQINTAVDDLEHGRILGRGILAYA